MISNCTVFPDEKSTMEDLKLSVSDLPMLSCHYIQKGCLFTRPPFPTDSVIELLKQGLSQTLSRFPPLAGRMTTDSDGHVFITCNDAGVDFIHANAGQLFVRDVLGATQVPDCFKEFFTFDRTVSYMGHFKPILAVQVTELADGIFIGCSVNHSVMDGTSFWNFFNIFADVCRGAKRITRPQPDFTRDSILISPAVLKLPEDVTNKNSTKNVDCQLSAVEILGKLSNDTFGQNDNNNGTKVTSIIENWLKTSVLTPTDSTKTTIEISSFQSLCALLWRAVTRARKLPISKTTTFRMAVNCRHRLQPKLDPFYFGNAIQSVPTYASAGDVLSRDLRWCAEQMNTNLKAHDSGMVRHFVEEWESNPRCFPLGNPDGASITMGSSPRFPMYDNDFGWGRPLAVRSGRANKFDGKISAFPGREGSGTVDLEVVLSPETMAALESDSEFMQYVSS
ncbi:hypothetical protein G4B88_013469 [Cannabis sativa]|uniref:Uncharacterized protein n=1 Tax=Cannabis sativa TaxID=3483 RepID=A0A7J6HKX4_CANSA|nr:hypothetical protein G4B88_013469 [Cannabis sativa]